MPLRYTRQVHPVHQGVVVRNILGSTPLGQSPLQAAAAAQVVLATAPERPAVVPGFAHYQLSLAPK